MKGLRVLVVLVALGFQPGSLMPGHPKVPTGGDGPSYWTNMARETLQRRLKMKDNTRIAKNVILFIGDGMGPTTVTAARILRGQLNNMPGEETVLAFEDFPNTATAKTYNVDRQTPDSAGTATAIMSGVKTNYYIVGLDGTARYNDCDSSAGKQVSTIADWANAVGKATGIVTTARITHATPAAAFAHSANRYWEGDVDLEGVPGNCKDIARQLVEDNDNIKVLMGGGRRFMLPVTEPDPEYGTVDKKQRKDGRNLVKEWEAKKAGKGTAKYVWNKDQFDDVDPRYTDHLLGLFEPNHMQYELDRVKSGEKGEPPLEEMTRKAIQILNKDRSGFFLLVEGARIDHGHHDSKAKKALHEVLAMEDAIRTAMELTNQDETLIVVTADHSIPFDINGYQYRGTDIFGLVEPVASDELTLDGLPYSVLSYSNGPRVGRTNLSEEDLHDKDYVYPSHVPVPWTTHGGEDTAIYARGPMSHLFHGVHEQNYIAHVMAYAACIGPYFGDCDRPEPETSVGAGTMATASSLLYLMTIYVVVMSFRGI